VDYLFTVTEISLHVCLMGCPIVHVLGGDYCCQTEKELGKVCCRARSLSV